MSCTKLIRGHDLRCYSPITKYFQQIVLINKSDINEVSFNNVNDTNHTILFNLVDGATGYKFIGNENINLYYASYSKTESKGQIYYNHKVTFPISGVGVDTKLLLKELDYSNLVAAIQFKDDTIEIYGFNNGMKTNNYTFNANGGFGGTSIDLESRFEEYEIPYIYGGDKEDFDNNFANIGDILGGDYNDDFNNDFDNLEI